MEYCSVVQVYSYIIAVVAKVDDDDDDDGRK